MRGISEKVDVTKVDEITLIYRPKETKIVKMPIKIILFPPKSLEILIKF